MFFLSLLLLLPLLTQASQPQKWEPNFCIRTESDRDKTQLLSIYYSGIGVHAIRFKTGEQYTSYPQSALYDYDKNNDKLTYNRDKEKFWMEQILDEFREMGCSDPDDCSYDFYKNHDGSYKPYTKTNNVAYYYLCDGSGRPIPDTRASKRRLGKLD
jgi:hypothetical protein